MTRAVLFDYGHTLVDFARPDDALLEAYHKISTRLSSELACEVPGAAVLVEEVSARVDRLIGESYESGAELEVDIGALYAQALSAIGLVLSPSTLEWVMSEEQVAWYAGVRPSPHAQDVLAALRSSGTRMAIVSNAAFPAEMMRSQMRHFELLEYFDATVFSSEIGVRKPHRAIYEEALSKIGADPRDTTFVGDRLREDVRGPQGLGITPVLTHEFRIEDPLDGDTVAVIQDLSQLEAVLSV